MVYAFPRSLTSKRIRFKERHKNVCFLDYFYDCCITNGPHPIIIRCLLYYTGSAQKRRCVRLFRQQYNRSMYNNLPHHYEVFINSQMSTVFFILFCLRGIIKTIVKVFIENLLDVRNTRRFNNCFCCSV